MLSLLTALGLLTGCQMVPAPSPAPTVTPPSEAGEVRSPEVPPDIPADAIAREFVPDERGYLDWTELLAESLIQRGLIHNMIIVSVDPVELWIAGNGLSPAQAEDTANLVCQSFQAAFPGQRAEIRVFQPHPEQIAYHDCGG